MRRRQEQAYGVICQVVDAEGQVPTSAELGQRMGITSIGAWKHIRGLIEDGRLKRLVDGRIVISGLVDLRPVPTDRLQAELARRRAVHHAETAR